MKFQYLILTTSVACIGFIVAGCGRNQTVRAEEKGAESNTAEANVGVVKIGTKDLGRELTISSELVPFQEIDVFAKESGYVKDLNVDYGTRVHKGQVMAVLEIPELQLQLQQDDATIKTAADQVTHAQHEVSRVEAQHRVLHLQFTRLDNVAKSQPGLVAQQEVDDAQGKDLASEAQIEASKSNLSVMQSELDAAKSKKERDQVLFDYSRITAPFAGVVTQRYANQGTLLQAGTTSSTQAMPLVRLSQDDLFRLVIPVPESYVRDIRIGSPVVVRIPALNKTYPGKVARFSVDVKEDTRTMHTEVDIPNTDRKLIPGMYAEATLTLEQKRDAIAVPLQAVSQQGTEATAYVVDAADKIEVRKLTLGLQTSSDAEVIAGLKPGEMVVVGDRGSLKPGQQVHPSEVDLVKFQEGQGQ
ncbi:MAG TPA: efflux RND transporter periplasmic adaptor subunit [Bryobacteraceae bacterium]|nr:efflux RND transporter periplasmic adaptor subunit [Bryobacteraceae bacterium]